MATTKKASTKNEENQSHTLKKKNTDKRKPKGPVKLNIQLNEEQKIAKDIILQNDIIVLLGKAGSGKTLLGCAVGIDLYFRRDYNRIRIARPTVSDEELGFLPGDISEKLDPWLQPIYHNFYQCYDKRTIQELVKSGDILISPLAYMKGLTYLDEYVILDEAQNITIKQMKMVITRLGKGSKLIFCGDTNQIDLQNKKDSGLGYLIEAGKNINGFCAIELFTNHRHEIVDSFLESFKKLEDDKKNNKLIN